MSNDPAGKTTRCEYDNPYRIKEVPINYGIYCPLLEDWPTGKRYSHAEEQRAW